MGVFCQIPVAPLYPTLRPSALGRSVVFYLHDTTEILLSCKMWRFEQLQDHHPTNIVNIKSGLLKTILEVKISMIVCWTCLLYFHEWKCLNISTLFIFRITQNYTFYCKSDKLNCVNHLTTVYLDENKTWT